MASSGPSPPSHSEWTGCAIYDATYHQVRVISPCGCWKSEIESAIAQAGGKRASIRESDCTSPPASPLAKGEFIITFTPKKGLTDDFDKHVEQTKRIGGKVMEPCGYMKPSGAFRNRSKLASIVYCPRCGDPATKGMMCPKCRCVMY
ncbi:MAG: hypothetical protein V1827_02930 [Candidatus Micrarchaeota archaeon]